MPARRRSVNLEITGGWSSDAGPSAPTLARDTPGGLVVSVPWLIDAENVVYHLDGWPRKMRGASATNATAVTESGSGITFMGIFDYWRSTASGDPVQSQFAVAGTQMFSSTDGATWTSRATGLQTDRTPAFAVMNDLLVIATDSTVDVPQSWNQTDATTSNLAGTPPNFAFHVVHKGRMWAAGVDSNKSRFYYSVLDNPQDWVGAGSGSIDVAPDDGDVITGLASHKDQLWVFKGPNRGSLHYVNGSAPTGSDAFSLHPFVTGVGCASHQSIVKFLDDVAWWDDNGAHSLKATAAYGNFTDAFLSRDIQGFVTRNLAHGRFRQIQGVHFPLGGVLLWTASRSGETEHGVILGLDYRFTPPRWFQWPAFAAASLGMIRDSNVLTPWAGTYGGQVLRLDRTARNVNGAAYTARATFPYLAFGSASFEKTLGPVRASYEPQGEASFTLTLTRDDQASQAFTITQSGGATLGPSSNQFVLDTSTLSGGRYGHFVIEEIEGEFRELQIELSQGGLNEDMAPHGLGLEIESPVLAGD